MSAVIIGQQWHLIAPPAPADRNDEDFVKWVEAVLIRLKRIDLSQIEITPFMTEDERLLIGFQSDEATAARVKAALYS